MDIPCSFLYPGKDKQLPGRFSDIIDVGVNTRNPTGIKLTIMEAIYLFCFTYLFLLFYLTSSYMGDFQIYITKSSEKWKNFVIYIFFIGASEAKVLQGQEIAGVGSPTIF